MQTIELVRYSTDHSRKASQGRPALPAGSSLWLLKIYGKFFNWGYVERASAERVARKLQTAWEREPEEFTRDYAANFTSNPTRIIPTWIKPEACL